MTSPHFYTKLFITLFALHLLSACGLITRHADVAESDLRVEVAAGVSFKLLDTTSFTRPLSISQVVEIAHDGESHRLLAELELNERQLIIVGLSSLGMRLFTLDYNAQNLSFSSSAMLPADFKPHYLLADIQLIYWPLAALQQQFENSGISIREEDEHRLYYRGGTKIIDIYFERGTGWASTVHLHHLERNYTLHINTVNIEETRNVPQR